MSYTDICDKFEVIAEHLKKGSEQVVTLCNFFKQYKRSFDIFSHYLSKIEDSISIETPSQGSIDTLSMALLSTNSHIKKLIQNNTGISKQIQLDIIEPLELFSEHYEMTKSEILNKGAIINRELQKAKDKAARYQKKYYNASIAAEKYESSKAEDLQNSKFLSKSFYSAQSEKWMEKYLQSLEEANLKKEKFDSIMPGIIETLQQSEESRIHFLKYSLEKYTKHFQKYETQGAGTLEELATVVDSVNSSIDVIIFVDINKSSEVENKKMRFVSYEEWKMENKKPNWEFREDDYEVMEHPDEEDNDLELIKGVINYLIPFQIGLEETKSTLGGPEEMEKLDENYHVKLCQVLGSYDGRRLFLDILESRNSLNCMNDYKLKELSMFFKETFNFIMMDNDNDPMLFCKILDMSHTFYSEDKEGKRKYLANYIHHPMLENKNLWIKAIDFAILCQIDADKEASIKNRPKPKSEGFFGSIIKQIANNIPHGFIKDQDAERAARSAAFAILSEFCVYINLIGVTIELANQIILKICQKYDLDSERICILLAEIQTNQKFNAKRASSSLFKREKESRKWESLLPFALSFRYLEPLDFISILQVSKHWKKAFQHHIYKKWLLDSNFSDKKLAVLRSKIWPESLRANTNLIDYTALLNKVAADPEIIGDSSDIIDMDVSRSYQNSSFISPQILTNLLKTYAFYNPDIGYCQGMNYIAGTLYIQLQSEEIAFKCMIGLIEKYQMSSLFIENLPKLKQFFYQLDRLIGLFMPDVQELFKDIEVSSAHFSSSWFLTIFANILQSQPEILIPIWDMFILEGWKAVFKVCIAIVERVSKVFIGVRFEDVMMVLSTIHMPNSPIAVFDDTFIVSVKSIKISSRLLRDLESEYKHLKLKASQKN